MFSCLNPQGEETESVAVNAFVESSEHVRILFKNRSAIGGLNQRSLFAVNLEYFLIQIILLVLKKFAENGVPKSCLTFLDDYNSFLE